MTDDERHFPEGSVPSGSLAAQARVAITGKRQERREHQEYQQVVLRRDCRRDSRTSDTSASSHSLRVTGSCTSLEELPEAQRSSLKIVHSSLDNPITPRTSIRSCPKEAVQDERRGQTIASGDAEDSNTDGQSEPSTPNSLSSTKLTDSALRRSQDLLRQLSDLNLEDCRHEPERSVRKKSKSVSEVSESVRSQGSSWLNRDSHRLDQSMRTVTLPTAFLKMIATTLDDLGTLKSSQIGSEIAASRRSFRGEEEKPSSSHVGENSNGAPMHTRLPQSSRRSFGHAGARTVGVPETPQNRLDLSLGSLGGHGSKSVGTPEPQPDLFDLCTNSIGRYPAKSSGLTETESHKDLSDLLMSTMTSSTGLPAYFSDGTWSPSWTPQSSRRSAGAPCDLLFQRPSTLRSSITPPTPVVPMALLRTKAMPPHSRVVPQQLGSPRLRHNYPCVPPEPVNIAVPLLHNQQVHNSPAVTPRTCLRQVSIATPRQTKLVSRSHSLPAAVSVSQTVTIRTKFAVS